MTAPKRKVTNTDLYKMLVRIHKKTDLILKRLNQLHKKIDFFESDEHDHNHDHDFPEYKA